MNIRHDGEPTHEDRERRRGAGFRMVFGLLGLPRAPIGSMIWRRKKRDEEDDGVSGDLMTKDLSLVPFYDLTKVK